MTTQRTLNENIRLVRGKAAVEAALSGVTALPASGSYVDTRGYEYVHIIVHLGTIHNSDSPAFEPKCAPAASGTLTPISADLKLTPSPANDDGKFLVWTIKTDALPADKPFLAVEVTGTTTNGSYADVVFLLDRARHLPVTQTQVALTANWVA